MWLAPGIQGASEGRKEQPKGNEENWIVADMRYFSGNDHSGSDRNGGSASRPQFEVADRDNVRSQGYRRKGLQRACSHASSTTLVAARLNDVGV